VACAGGLILGRAGVARTSAIVDRLLLRPGRNYDSSQGDTMLDYEPVDLGPLCNAGSAIYAAVAAPPTRRLTFPGLPYLVGGAAPDPARCFVALGPSSADSAVTVPIGAAARHVLFAHALLDSRLLENAPVGAAVAHYSIRYTDGAIVRVPV